MTELERRIGMDSSVRVALDAVGDLCYVWCSCWVSGCLRSISPHRALLLLLWRWAGVDGRGYRAGDPGGTVRAASAAWAANPSGTLAMWIRDRLAGVFGEEDFAGWFPVDGRRGLSPVVLALVSVLQLAE
jgi:hypothetical protein